MAAVAESFDTPPPAPSLAVRLEEDALFKELRDVPESRFLALTLADFPLGFNPAYVLAVRLAESFHLHGLPFAISCVTGGGVEENLPIAPHTAPGFADLYETVLARHGIALLCSCRGRPAAAYFRVPTLGAGYPELDVWMTLMRIAQQLKVLVRDRAAEEEPLNRWLSHYTGVPPLPLAEGSAEFDCGQLRALLRPHGADRAITINI